VVDSVSYHNLLAVHAELIPEGQLAANLHKWWIA